MQIDSIDTGLAFDMATPVEFALTSLFDGSFLCVVAPATAQQVAAVHPNGGPVATSSLCA